MRRIEDNKSIIVLLAAMGINLLNGMLYTWSAFSLHMVNLWGWTSKQASLPYTMHTIFVVITMISFGRLQDIKGPKGIATVGSLLLGLGLILAGFTQSPSLMLVYIGLMVGSGIGIHTVSTTPSAVKWFPSNKKGLITGLVTSGAAASAILYSFLGNYLINNFDISRTFIILGSIILVFTVFFARLLDIPSTSDKMQNKSNWSTMLKDKTFYKIWIMKAFSDAAGLLIISHIASISLIQVNWDKGFILILLISTSNALGRILGGAISDRIGRINLMKIVMTIQALNIILFSFYRSVPVIIMGVIIAGFCYGSGFAVYPAFISDLYGERNFGLNYGILHSAWAAGGVIGPMTGATVYDLSGNYQLAYIVGAGLLLIALMVAFSFKKERSMV